MAGEYDVMNSPEFGAFGGAKFQQDSQLKALEALHRAGQIQKQPAELELAKAHARLYGAQAQEHEANVADMQALAGLAKEAGGNTVTPGSFGGGSLADPLLNMIKLGESRGLYRPLVKLRTQAVDILSKEALTEDRQAETEKRLVDAKRMQLRTEASSALAASQSQANYDRWLLSNPTRVSSMPVRVEDAREALLEIVTQGMDAEKVLKMQSDKVNQDSLIKRRSKQEKLMDMRIGESDARTKNIKARTEILGKTVGKNSPETTESQKVLNEQRRVRTQLLLDKDWPLAPPNPKDLVVNKGYRNLKRQKAIWTGTGWLAQVDKKVAPIKAEEEEDDLLDETDSDTGQ